MEHPAEQPAPLVGGTGPEEVTSTEHARTTPAARSRRRRNRDLRGCGVRASPSTSRPRRRRIAAAGKTAAHRGWSAGHCRSSLARCVRGRVTGKPRFPQFLHATVGLGIPRTCRPVGGPGVQLVQVLAVACRGRVSCRSPWSGPAPPGRSGTARVLRRIDHSQWFWLSSVLSRRAISFTTSRSSRCGREIAFLVGFDGRAVHFDAHGVCSFSVKPRIARLCAAPRDRRNPRSPPGERRPSPGLHAPRLDIGLSA